MRAVQDWLKQDPQRRVVSLVRYDEIDKKFEVYLLKSGNQIIVQGDTLEEALHNAVHKIEGVM